MNKILSSTILILLMMVSIATALSPLEPILFKTGIGQASYDTGRNGVDAGCSLASAKNYCTILKSGNPGQTFYIYYRNTASCADGKTYAVDSMSPPTYSFLQACDTGITCTSHSTYKCYSLANNIYWYDSCGNTEGLKETCTNGCIAGSQTCKSTTCTTNAYIECSNGAVYNFDSCGNKGTLSTSCTSTQTCIGKTCQEKNLPTDLSLSEVNMLGPPVKRGVDSSTGIITISQVTYADRAGRIMVEAGIWFIGMDQPRSSTPTVGINYCNPNERWYANQYVNLDAGVNVVTFTLIPETIAGNISSIAWGKTLSIHTALIQGGCGSTTQEVTPTTITITMPSKSSTQIKCCRPDGTYTMYGGSCPSATTPASSDGTCPSVKLQPICLPDGKTLCTAGWQDTTGTYCASPEDETICTGSCINGACTTPQGSICQSCQAGSPVTEQPFDTSGNLISSYTIARSATTGTSLDVRCEDIMNALGSRLKTYLDTPQCFGTSYAENINYYKPVITRIWYVPDIGNKIEITGDTIPTEITKTWKAGMEYTFQFEISNAGADSYNTNKPQWLKSLSGFIDIGNQIADYVATVGTVGISEAARALIPRDLVEQARSSEYLGLVQAELAIYSVDAAEEAYKIPAYSRQGILDPYTIYNRDNCQATETGQGWIKSFTVLMSSPVDGVCYAPDSTLFGKQVGWGCKNVIVTAKVKIPSPGDAIASGTNNWDENGNYQLAASVYDRCYYDESNKPSWIKTASKKLMITPEKPGVPICCQTTSWIFLHQYNELSAAECTSRGGTAVADSKCVVKEEETCYSCELVSGNVMERPAVGGVCDSGFSKGKSGKTAEEKKCNIPPRPPCTSGEYRTCKSCDILGTTDNHVCTSNDCPSGFFELSEWSDKCAPYGSVNCFICDSSNKGATIAYTNNPVKKISAEELDSATCDRIQGYADETLAKQGCANILTPSWQVCSDDSTKWCAYSKGKVILTGERKDPIPLSELKNLDKLTVWEKVTSNFLQSSDNPICLKASGDVMCVDDSECLVAKDSTLSTYKENKQVYDALEEATTTHLDKFIDIGTTIASGGLNKVINWIFDINQKKAYIEQYGVCVPKERGIWAQIKRFVADLFGLDPNDPAVTYIIIGGIAVILLLLYVATRPKPIKIASPPRPF